MGANPMQGIPYRDQGQPTMTTKGRTMRPARVYSVTVNMPGYLPMDDNLYAFTRKDHAHSYAAQRARELREEGFRVVGSRGDYYADRADSAEDYNITTDVFSTDEWEAMGNDLP